jgi:uncharacterized protein YndB with AHSA1/START domain
MHAKIQNASSTLFVAPPGIAELHVTHLFDAPVELVFKTWIDQKLLPEWWGPAYLSTTVERMEPKSGGGYQIIQRAPDGKVHGFRGVYHTVEAPHLIISTFEYDGFPHHVSLDTYRFEASGEQTLHTNASVFQSLADRDGMVAANCEPGVRETMARMEKLLQQLKETT